MTRFFMGMLVCCLSGPLVGQGTDSVPTTNSGGDVMQLETARHDESKYSKVTHGTHNVAHCIGEKHRIHRTAPEEGEQRVRGRRPSPASGIDCSTASTV